MNVAGAEQPLDSETLLFFGEAQEFGEIKKEKNQHNQNPEAFLLFSYCSSSSDRLRVGQDDLGDSMISLEL